MANETVQVGKYTLESLTTGMYSDPKIVYREYIQNAVDSLETAVAQNLIEPQGMRIDIVIDEENASISIRDNGMGIPCAQARDTLMNVGNSRKRHSNNRGFRGGHLLLASDSFSLSFSHQHPPHHDNTQAAYTETHMART